MKQAAEYARRVRKLMGLLKKEGSVAALPPVDDPMEQLLRGIFTDFIGEGRANSALVRLRTAVVDVNELRVTPISEIVEILGSDLSCARRAGEEISRSLNAIYNKLHHLDLSFISKGSKRTAEAFLNNLPGVNAHARATVILRCLKGAIVPVDTHMSDFLRHGNYVPPDATVDTMQRFLASVVPESQLGSFYAHLKRYAAAHAPRKPLAPLPPPTPPKEEVAVSPPPALPVAPSKGAREKDAKPSKDAGKVTAKVAAPAKPVKSAKPAKPAPKSAKSSKARSKTRPEPASRPKARSARPARARHR